MNIDFYVESATHPDTGVSYYRTEPIGTPREESAIDLDTEILVFHFEVHIQKGHVDIKAVSDGVRFDTDLQFTVDNLASQYELNIKNMSIAEIEDWISDEMCSSDFIYVAEGDIKQ